MWIQPPSPPPPTTTPIFSTGFFFRFRENWDQDSLALGTPARDTVPGTKEVLITPLWGTHTRQRVTREKGSKATTHRGC